MSESGQTKKSLNSRRHLAANVSRRAWLSCLFIFGTMAILAFQNCTQGPEVEDTEISSEAAKLDFSYDASIDQIAYMSCGNMGGGSYDRSAFFTIRAGAYRTGGLRLTPAFRTTMDKKTATKQAEILSESPINNSTVPQLAIRPMNDLRTIISNSGSSIASGEDYQNMLLPLGTLEISDMLVAMQPNSRMRYVRDGTVMGARFEGSLHFTVDYGRESSVRQGLSGQSNLLTLSFTQGSNGDDNNGAAVLPRSPADLSTGSTDPAATPVPGTSAMRSAYGRGYRIQFRKPDFPTHEIYPSNVIASITETSLLDNADRSVSGTWTCPSNMQFRIVRSEDVGTKGSCLRMPDPAVLTPELAIIRHSLKVEDWYVDMANKCIIPKKASGSSGCYGSFQNVAYNMSATCNPNADGVCVAMASVCYRTD